MAGKKKQIFYQELGKEFISNGFNMTGALRKLRPYKTELALRVDGSKTLSNPNFRQELNVILQDIDDNVINNKLQQLLEAKHISDYKGKVKLTELPNYSEQRKTLQMITEMRGLYPKTTINKDIKAEFKFKIKEMNAEQLRQLLTHQDDPGEAIEGQEDIYVYT